MKCASHFDMDWYDIGYQQAYNTSAYLIFPASFSSPQNLLQGLADFQIPLQAPGSSEKQNKEAPKHIAIFWQPVVPLRVALLLNMNSYYEIGLQNMRNSAEYIEIKQVV